MAVNQGARGTGILTTETRRVRDVSPALFQLEPNAGPLVTILMKIAKQEASDPKIEWFEDELLPRFDLLASAIADGNATTMVVTNYKYFRAGDIVMINNAEQVLVNTTPSSTSVSITRGYGTTSATAHSSGVALHIIGNVNEEGATKRSLLSTIRQPKYNYLQIFRNPFGYTETASKTSQFAGNDADTEKAKHLIEHKKDIELSFLFGEPKEDTSGTHPKRKTGGVKYFITTNVVSAGGTLTEAELQDFMRQVMAYGSSERLLLASPLLASVISGFASAKLQTRSDDKTYGITLSRYQNAGRVVEISEHKLLRNDSVSDNTGIAGWGLCLDMSDLALKHLPGRFATLRENIQANDADAREDEYLSECGLQLALEKKHGILTGVTG